MSKTLHHAFDLRQIGDYREFLTISEGQAQEILASAEEFVTAIEEFLAN